MTLQNLGKSLSQGTMGGHMIPNPTKCCLIIVHCKGDWIDSYAVCDFKISKIDMIGKEAIPGGESEKRLRLLELPVLPCDHYGPLSCKVTCLGQSLPSAELRSLSLRFDFTSNGSRYETQSNLKRVNPVEPEISSSVEEP
ncbi:hypothetical protein SADUNF_Sadunf04G0005900 [Salix dunnii]|uniref:Uncharacterized protein n=1 Tax=Salix dunnii TaxID=1413687 RepID=A0A835K9F8_9ROSI|nr:hypothetical protein SADUNF_Sadunf04G0005900 [Salix dunnii]